jgi:hypothetical protein
MTSNLDLTTKFLYGCLAFSIEKTFQQPYFLLCFSRLSRKTIMDTDLPIKGENISLLIHFVRGEKVLLDFDLALLYGVEVKRLKEAVRRNMQRFPADFIFELNKAEMISLRSQFASLKRGQHRNHACVRSAAKISGSESRTCIEDRRT